MTSRFVSMVCSKALVKSVFANRHSIRVAAGRIMRFHVRILVKVGFQHLFLFISLPCVATLDLISKDSSSLSFKLSITWFYSAKVLSYSFNQNCTKSIKESDSFIVICVRYILRRESLYV